MEKKNFKENIKQCECEEMKPDENFFGGYKKPGQKIEKIYCHCKVCGGRIYYE